MDYLHLVGFGQGGPGSMPAIDETGRFRPVPGEQVLWLGDWRELRVHRDRVTTSPAQSLATGGTLLVTDRRIAWLTSNFDSAAGTAGRGFEYATIAVTGSLVAGWAARKSAGRRRQRQRQMESAGVVAGQLLTPWLDYVGFHSPMNMLRLVVRERFTDRNMTISIDLLLDSGNAARPLAASIAGAIAAQRPSGTKVQDPMPEDNADGKVAGINLPGGQPVNATS